MSLGRPNRRIELPLNSSTIDVMSFLKQLTTMRPSSKLPDDQADDSSNEQLMSTKTRGEVRRGEELRAWREGRRDYLWRVEVFGHQEEDR